MSSARRCERPSIQHQTACSPAAVLVLCALIADAITPAAALKLRFSCLGDKECVSQSIAAKSYVTGSFVSLPGPGLPGLLGGRVSYDLQVLNPQGRTIHSLRDREESNFSFKARYAGRYQFCLSVAEHLGTAILKHGHRDVLWEVHVGHTIAHSSTTNPHIEPLWRVLDTVEGDLADMKALQQYFHNCEIRNRATTLSTSGRIISWAILRCLTLVGVALFQISFIRRLFERPKRSVHV